jgi:hypothetical protein
VFTVDYDVSFKNISKRKRTRVAFFIYSDLTSQYTQMFLLLIKFKLETDAV